MWASTQKRQGMRFQQGIHDLNKFASARGKRVAPRGERDRERCCWTFDPGIAQPPPSLSRFLSCSHHFRLHIPTPRQTRVSAYQTPNMDSKLSLTPAPSSKFTSARNWIIPFVLTNEHNVEVIISAVTSNLHFLPSCNVSLSYKTHCKERNGVQNWGPTKSMSRIPSKCTLIAPTSDSPLKMKNTTILMRAWRTAEVIVLTLALFGGCQISSNPPSICPCTMETPSLLLTVESFICDCWKKRSNVRKSPPLWEGKDLFGRWRCWDELRSL